MRVASRRGRVPCCGDERARPDSTGPCPVGPARTGAPVPRRRRRTSGVGGALTPGTPAPVRPRTVRVPAVRVRRLGDLGRGALGLA
ncbi:hypothetical protein RU06_12100 [Curtobacterium flaccumfaciens]|nr:hypothetical protein RU06_12100 [Curtobacterium flaccumfaciens]